jgi:hypothetical protein
MPLQFHLCISRDALNNSPPAAERTRPKTTLEIGHFL